MERKKRPWVLAGIAALLLCVWLAAALLLPPAQAPAQLILPAAETAAGTKAPVSASTVDPEKLREAADVNAGAIGLAPDETRISDTPAPMAPEPTE